MEEKIYRLGESIMGNDQNPKEDRETESAEEKLIFFIKENIGNLTLPELNEICKLVKKSLSAKQLSRPNILPNDID
jgi:hypothetical protein